MKPVGWKRLENVADNRFRLQRAALLGYACATLPTRFSRRVVSLSDGAIDPSAMPAEIWLKGDEVAFVWYVHHENAPPYSAPRRIVGFVRQVAGLGFEHLDLSTDDRVPQAFADAEPVRFSDQFWRSDLNLKAPAENNESDNPVDIDQIRRAQQIVDDAFRKTISTDTALSMTELELVPIITDTLASTWRLQHDWGERQRVADLLKLSGVCNFRFEATTPKRMVLLERDVPFYKDCRLYRVIDMRGPRSRFTSFVLHEKTADIAPLGSHEETTNIFPLDSHAQLIDNFHSRRASKGELHIDESSVGAYLRFYCEFMHGKEEVFSFIESSEDLRWLSQASTQQRTVVRQLFTKEIMPVALYKPGFALPAASFPPQHPAHRGASSSLYERPPAIYCRVYISRGRFLLVAGIAVHPDGNFDKFASHVLHPSELPIHPPGYDVQSWFVLRTDALKQHPLGQGPN